MKRTNPCTCPPDHPSVRYSEGDNYGPDSRFAYCGHCGAKLGWESEVAAALSSAAIGEANQTPGDLH
jgi:hypothetical protein